MSRTLSLKDYCLTKKNRGYRRTHRSPSSLTLEFVALGVLWLLSR
jgi:hypothetical protein